MALIGINLAMANVLWYFDFHRVSGPEGNIGGGKDGLGIGREREGEFQIYDVGVATHDGPYLGFKPRSDAWKELYTS